MVQSNFVIRWKFVTKCLFCVFFYVRSQHVQGYSTVLKIEQGVLLYNWEKINISTH